MPAFPISPTTNTSSAPAIDDSVANEIELAVQGPSLALMLYGSQARGSADTNSDVDVLQMVARHAGAYKSGRVSVTAYTPDHLHQMAVHGSLFVLHLRTEGIKLMDSQNILCKALAAYRAPTSYQPLLAELGVAARAVSVTGAQFNEYYQALGRLGIYLLRSWLYVGGTTAEKQNFDADAAAAALGDKDLLRVLRLRRAESLSYADAAAVRSQVMRTFGTEQHTDSLPALAVKLAIGHPHASALVAQVFTNFNSIDYAATPLPPL